MPITKFYLTDKGANLYAKNLAGAAMNFTKVQIGKGDVPSGTNIVTTSALYDLVKTFSISSITTSAKQAQIKFQFTNSDISAPFSWKEVGVFATDPDEGEILYIYGNAGTEADPIPAYSTQADEFLYNVICKIANSETTTATIDKGLIYIAQSEKDVAGGVAGYDTLKAFMDSKGTDGGLALFDDAKLHYDNKNNPHNTNAAQVGAVNPNLLINGDFRINQRGSSIYTITGSSKYTIDRWIALSDSGITTSVSKCDGVGGSFGNNYLRICALAVTVSGLNNIYQYIEDDSNGYSRLSGKTVTFSAKCSSNTCDFRTMYIGYFDSNNVVHILVSKSIPASTYGVISITGTLPTAVHKVHVAFTCNRVLTSADVGVNFDVTDAKFEIGSVSTLLSPRPYAEELALCQRYYLSDLTGYCMLILADSLSFYITIPRSMKGIPTLLSTPIVISSGVQQNGFTFSVVTMTSNIVQITATKTAHGLTNSNPIVMYNIVFDSEIY